jgi:hypothetical protein
MMMIDEFLVVPVVAAIQRPLLRRLRAKTEGKPGRDHRDAI